MTQAQNLLQKLRDPQSAGALVQAGLQALLDRPVSALVDVPEVAVLLRDSLRGHLGSEAAEHAILAQLQSQVARADAMRTPMAKEVPAELSQLTRELTQRPYQPRREVVLAVLDREPVRKLIRTLLQDAMIDFGKKLISTVSHMTPGKDSRVARGIGGMLGTLGAVAGAVGGAVTGELEKGLEKRAGEAADFALSRVLQKFADHLCDPRYAQDQAELRAALVEGALSLQGHDLALEAQRLEYSDLVRAVRKGLLKWALRDALTAELTDELNRAVGPYRDLTARAALDLLGLRGPVEATMTAWFTRQLAVVAQSPAVEAWFEAALAP
jgi:hypothetical protein